MSDERKNDVTIKLTHGELLRLHEEIGDIPRAHVGRKLLEFYRRLDGLVGLAWAPQPVGRPKRQ